VPRIFWGGSQLYPAIAKSTAKSGDFRGLEGTASFDLSCNFLILTVLNVGSTNSPERIWTRAASPQGEGQDGPSLKIAERFLDVAAQPLRSGAKRRTSGRPRPRAIPPPPPNEKEPVFHAPFIWDPLPALDDRSTSAKPTRAALQEPAAQTARGMTFQMHAQSN
jgi:hypothetical protein